MTAQDNIITQNINCINLLHKYFPLMWFIVAYATLITSLQFSNILIKCLTKNTFMGASVIMCNSSNSSSTVK